MYSSRKEVVSAVGEVDEKGRRETEEKTPSLRPP